MDSHGERSDRVARGRRLFDALRRRAEMAAGESGNGSDVTPEAERSQPQPDVDAHAGAPEPVTLEDTASSGSPESGTVEDESTPPGNPDDAPPTTTDPRLRASEAPSAPLPGAAELERYLHPPAGTPGGTAPPAPPRVEPTLPPAPPSPVPPAPAQAEAQLGAPGPAPDTTLPRVVAVANQKGGVGKTTTAVNLGASLAELGYRVLVVDLDPQGNATTGLGIDIRNLDGTVYDALMSSRPLEDVIEATSVRNLFVAPSNMDLAGAEIELVSQFSRELKLRRALEPVRDDYEWILVDCPPSLGLLTVNGLAAADDVVVPIQCEYYALEGLGQLIHNVNLVRANLNPVLEIRGIVLTMYDARTKLADQVVDEVRRHFGAKVYQRIVPRTVRLSEAPSFGQPIIVYDPSSRGTEAYRDLAREVSRGAPPPRARAGVD